MKINIEGLAPTTKMIEKEKERLHSIARGLLVACLVLACVGVLFATNITKLEVINSVLLKLQFGANPFLKGQGASPPSWGLDDYAIATVVMYIYLTTTAVLLAAGNTLGQLTVDYVKRGRFEVSRTETPMRFVKSFSIWHSLLPVFTAMAAFFSGNEVLVICTLMAASISFILLHPLTSFTGAIESLDEVTPQNGDCAKVLETIKRHKEVASYRDKVVKEGRKFIKAEFTAIIRWQINAIDRISKGQKNRESKEVFENIHSA